MLPLIIILIDQSHDNQQYKTKPFTTFFKTCPLKPQLRYVPNPKNQSFLFNFSNWLDRRYSFAFPFQNYVVMILYIMFDKSPALRTILQTIQFPIMNPKTRQCLEDSFESYQSHECGIHLNNSLSPQKIAQNIEALKTCPHVEKFTFQLTNFIHRCHNPHTAQAYHSFLNDMSKNLPQPQISTLYSNWCFPDFGKIYKNDNKERPEDIAEMPKPKSTVVNALDNVFNAHGYIPNLERFLMRFPTYLEKHLLAEADLLEGERLDQKLAYFIAFVTAAEKGSVYMMARYLKKFFRSGGDLEWLSQGTYPKKLQPILVLVHKMSHSAWEITHHMVTNILEDENYRWNLNELALITQIIAFAGHDSTIALAMGLLPEDPDILNQLNLKKIVQIQLAYDAKLESLSNNSIRNYGETAAVQKQNNYCVCQGQDNFERVETEGDQQEISEISSNLQLPFEQVDLLQLSRRISKKKQIAYPYISKITSEMISKKVFKEISALLSPILTFSEPNERRSDTNHMQNIDYADYNYMFMAYPILNNLTGSAADRIQTLLQQAQDMTASSFESRNFQETRDFRKSVKYYAQNLCGYTHQGYDYKTNMQSLNIPFKFYIKLLMLSPFFINKQVIRYIHSQNSEEQYLDLGYIAVLIAATKMTLQLTLTVQAFDL